MTQRGPARLKRTNSPWGGKRLRFGHSFLEALEALLNHPAGPGQIEAHELAMRRKI